MARLVLEDLEEQAAADPSLVPYTRDLRAWVERIEADRAATDCSG